VEWQIDMGRLTHGRVLNYSRSVLRRMYVFGRYQISPSDQPLGEVHKQTHRFQWRRHVSLQEHHDRYITDGHEEQERLEKIARMVER